MPLPPLYGHDDLKERLKGALEAGRLPPALLITGPWGIGKQRLALWAAAGLLCEKGPGAPCGACNACRMSANLSHPDLNWFFPIPRPKGDDAKQAEEAEESLAAALQARREQPLYGPSDGMHALYLPLVRVLHRRAQMRPAMAKRKVFVIGEADRLVPQASSPEAANAMLKLLEEPPPDTYFILTTAELPAILPTIRSRLVQMRAKRLPSAAVERFLAEQADVPAPAAKRRAALAAGSIGEALALAGSGEQDKAGADLLAAARKGGAERWRYVLGVKPYQARGAFTDTLDGALDQLKDELERRLRGGGADSPPAAPLLEAIKAIEAARRMAQGNVNPQLITADLLAKLSDV